MTAREWTLRLIYPKLPLSLNDRGGWQARYRAQRLLRDQIRVLARAQRIPRMDRIEVELHWTPATRRPRDQDNAVATLKPIIDGLRDYPPRRSRGVVVDPGWTGIVADDTPDHVEWPRPVIHEPDPALRERLVVVIRAL